MGNSVKRDKRKLAIAERRRKALDLRCAGNTYEQVAKQLGTDRGTIWRDIVAAIRDVCREPAEHVLQLELKRLDSMLVGVLSKAKSGDCQAIDRVLRIQERRAAYLGLDSPKRNEHTGRDGGPITSFDLSKLSDEQLERFLDGELSPVGGTAQPTTDAGEGGADEEA